MGTILKEGEQILVSRKITEEIGRSFRGYAVLIHIGIDIDKLTCAHDDTQHFLTYEVTEDLELPFDNSKWQDFEIVGVRFHAYTHNFKNLILMEHDECCLDYYDEIVEFFKKEKENMSNNKFMLPPDVVTVSRNWRELDNVIFADNPAFGFRDVTQSVPDKLPDITLEDLSFESSVRTEPLIRGTFRVSPGIIRETRRFQFTQYADSLNIHAMPRGLGRSATISMLNSIYGLNGGLSYKKPPLKFKLIFGQEHATGRYKTICLWEDGEKTIIHGDNKVTKLPVAQAFAWCYVKRTFGTVSHFKKHVDKRTTKMDGVWYFEGDCIMDDYAQGSVPGTSKKRDIYDAAALAIVTKRYGGLRKLVDEYINKED